MTLVHGQLQTAHIFMLSTSGLRILSSGAAKFVLADGNVCNKVEQ